MPDLEIEILVPGDSTAIESPPSKYDLEVQLANVASTDAVTDIELAEVQLPEGVGASGGDSWDDLTDKPAVIAAGATAGEARDAIGAGTSSFSGAYGDLSDKPSLGTAAAAAVGDFATAAQGAKADTAVQPARTVSAGTGLTGGGSLAADRTLAADFGTGAGKVTEGNDSRLSDARTPTAHNHVAADVTDFTEASQDVIGAMVAAAGGTYNDGAFTLPAGGGVSTAEVIQQIGIPGSPLNLAILEVAGGGGGGTIPIDRLPAGAVISTTSATARPSTRSDLVCLWLGADPGSNALADDVWLGS